MQLVNNTKKSLKINVIHELNSSVNSLKEIPICDIKRVSDIYWDNCSCLNDNQLKSFNMAKENLLALAKQLSIQFNLDSNLNLFVKCLMMELKLKDFLPDYHTYNDDQKAVVRAFFDSLYLWSDDYKESSFLDFDIRSLY